MKTSHALLSAAVSGVALGLLQATAWAAPAGGQVPSGFDSPTGGQLDADAGAKHVQGPSLARGRAGCKSDRTRAKGRTPAGQGGCRTDHGK
jgi:hypothetical protein